MKTTLFFFGCALVLSTGLLMSGCGKDNDNGNGGPEDPSWPTDSVRTVIGTLSQPWEILWGPDDHIWLTERGGRISRLEPRTGTLKPLLNVPDAVQNNEGGLLGMALHPDFKTNGYLYVVYNYNKGNAYTEKVVRYTYKDSTLSSPLVLLDNIAAAGIHNGSRLLIADNKLWITTGDAAVPANAQNTGNPNGKVLRINLDGSIPADNPIANNPLWSYGHRNPQGLVLANGKLYASEHGANIEDEVNIIEKQRNYGWPNVEGPCNTDSENTFCAANNVKAPLWSSGTSGTFAVAGMDYYNNDRIPQWKNSLLVTSLKNSRLYQLKLSGDGLTVASTKEYFSGKFGRLRDVCISPAGRVYICTGIGNNNDKVIEISKPE
ncbi:PQQ-dependent sugar dehydrogenase [Chitinophaga horti]|uniref:PQQ-dependent sugar dehydrogenase n=1 Tax=Chitinophaga horti TaxID=2920382 RepID=A0ABY6J1X6_9BACT|nr:PQQ-dependent sugar dehydrogenase [Chitinophaga horti]UYQ93679.1 PQQ-dependent sugar dehydrogenase [Chitinophaga horti]